MMLDKNVTQVVLVWLVDAAVVEDRVWGVELLLGERGKEL
jgi:hypothetical protein